MVKEISVFDLKQLQDEKKEVVVIDVRNPDEYEYCNIGGELIPMQEIPERFSEIPKDKTVVVQCHHGGRSAQVVNWLEQAQGYENVFNLAGGIHAWSNEIDSGIPTY